MKTILSIVVVITATFGAALSQSTITANAKKEDAIKETLVNLEKRMWLARKDKDDKHIYLLTSEDFVSVGESGVANRAAILKTVARQPCQIKSFDMQDVSVKILNASAGLLSYRLVQERVCEGVTGSSSAWASSVYLKQNGKWLNAFHQETPAGNSK